MEMSGTQGKMGGKKKPAQDLRQMYIESKSHSHTELLKSWGFPG